jgi:predicted GNAT family acetyltransferase
MRGGEVIAKARALSDMVGNAYIVDVWTWTPFRRQGIATRLLQLLLERLQGQHVCLLADERHAFYHALGFRPQQEALSLVVGRHLSRE